MADIGNKENSQDIDAQLEKQRNDDNNAKNIKNAAEVAIASKNPYAAAAGAVVKYGDKLTGGKVSQTAGKVITQVNKRAPMGKKVQKKSNKLAESGASDAIGKIYSIKSSSKDGAKIGNNASAINNKTNKPSNETVDRELLQDNKTSSESSNANISTNKRKKTKPLLIILLLLIIILALPLILFANIKDILKNIHKNKNNTSINFLFFLNIKFFNSLNNNNI